MHHPGLARGSIDDLDGSGCVPLEVPGDWNVVAVSPSEGLEGILECHSIGFEAEGPLLVGGLASMFGP
jgi:hypothetical protein